MAGGLVLPGDILNVLTLSKKDAGRPRFKVLARVPIREEKAHPATSKHIITGGEFQGQLTIRGRSVQGHSGELMKDIQRIGQRRLDAAGYPGLLLHTSLFDNMERICAHGLAPGGDEELENR